MMGYLLKIPDMNSLRDVSDTLQLHTESFESCGPYCRNTDAGQTLFIVNLDKL